MAVSALETARSTATLRAIWNVNKRRLKSSCFGPDRVTGRAFEAALPQSLRAINRRMSGEFSPDGLLAVPKLKPTGGYRVICVPTVADRLIQFALLVPLRERLKAMGLDNQISYGLAPGRDRSVLGARKFACQIRQERPWVYKADIAGFFDNLDRAALKRTIRRAVAQRSLVPIVTAFVDAEISDGIDRGWRGIVATAGIHPSVGVRQGMPLSPWYAGLYLRELDRRLIASGVPAARYVDDIVAFFETENECQDFDRFLRSALEEVGLRIGELGGQLSKTFIFPPEQPAAFLGMEITAHNGRYCLFVPDRSMDDIRDRFTKISTPAGLLENRVHLTTMGKYFESVECGYLNGYEEAHNRDTLRDLVCVLSGAAQRHILETIFGPVRLEQLTPEELEFVGVTELTQARPRGSARR